MFQRVCSVLVDCNEQRCLLELDLIRLILQRVKVAVQQSI